MFIDDVIEIKRPDPLSHFRLVNCEACRGDNVAFVKYENKMGHVRFRVSCFDCGRTVDNGADCAHGAQVAWNGKAVSL